MVIALILVTVFLIINTIKLTIFSRKREISIMRLVGASNFTIKTPFIIEGMVLGLFGSEVRSAAGINFNNLKRQEATNLGLNMASGVTTLKGAMLTMDIAESSIKMLDKIRSDLGSVQGQMISTVNNISVTQVHVKAAESQIREVDFAAESAEFSKLNILTQSGSYAMSQANAVQQNILRLLN